MWQGLFKPVLLKRQGVALGLWGDAGVGKSYQVQAFLHALTCRSSSLHATVSLATLAQSLPKPQKLPLWADRTLTRLAGGEEVESTSVTASLGAVFAGLVPFVLHLEDVHEVHPVRQALIYELAQVVLRTSGAGLIVTSRRALPEPFTPVQLLPLSEDASRALLERTLGAEPPPEAARWIYGRAAGNPLYTLEYLRYLTRQGFLWSDGKHWHWRVPPQGVMPPTVEALIERLVKQAQITPPHSAVLEAKALLPRDVGAEVWSQVAHVTPPELQAALKAFSQQGLFHGEAFAHPLFREVTLKTMSSERKRDLSRRAVNALSDQPEQAALFVGAAGLEPAEALEVLRRAAIQARKLGGEAQAGRFQARMTEYLQGEERSKIAFEAALDLFEYDLAESIRLLELAHQTSPDNFEIFARLAVYLAQAGKRLEVEHLLKGLPLAEQTSSRELMLNIAVFHYLQDPAQVAELWELHPELHEAATPTTVRNVAFSKADLGDAVGAFNLVNKALSQSQLSVEEQAVLLETCGFSCYAQSDFVAAVLYYTQAIELFRKNSQAHRTSSLLFNRAIALQNLARFSESVADAEEALLLAAEAGHALFYANAQLALGMAQIERGAYEIAETCFLECERYYQQTEMTQWLVDAHIGLSELYRDWQTPYSGVLARKHAERALLLARTLNNPRYLTAVMPYVVMTRALCSEPQSALELAAEAYPLCQADNVLLAKLLRARANANRLLSRSAEALGELRHAEAILQHTDIPLDAAKIKLEIAHLTHNLGAARTQLEWFEDRGLMNGANLAKRYFPALVKDPEIAATSHPQACLDVLGPMQLRCEGKRLDVRGRRRQNLLAVLLEARLTGRAEVSKLELLDTLYGDEDELRAAQSLKTLIHSVRKDLGDIILTTHTGYSLGRVTSDAESFLETADTVLWRGTYLGGAESRQGTVQDALYLSLLGQAERLLATDPQETARVARLLLEADPYSAPYLRLTLQALQNCNYLQTLGHVYDEAREHFAELGERLPDTWAAFLERQTDA